MEGLYNYFLITRLSNQPRAGCINQISNETSDLEAFRLSTARFNSSKTQKIKFVSIKIEE